MIFSVDVVDIDFVVVVVVVVDVDLVEVWVDDRNGFLNDNFGLAVVQNNKDSGIGVAAVDFVWFCVEVEKVIMDVIEDTVVVEVEVDGVILIVVSECNLLE